MAGKACKDCGSTTRALSKPGPRCATCWRVETKRRKDAKHEQHVQQTYGLGEGEYAQLYELQGRVCALCQRATGRSKKLAVDHDHRTGKVRGLLCSPCNKDVLGHARDSVAYFRRCIDYLESPPYEQLKSQDSIILHGHIDWMSDRSHVVVTHAAEDCPGYGCTRWESGLD